MKDAVATMGNILPDDAGGRDAVHVAVVSAVSDTTLYHGDHVGLHGTLNETGDVVVIRFGKKAVGIVDPFLGNPVEPGQRFWVYLYPRTITGLSHRWAHPDFPDAQPQGVYAPPASKLASEQWLRDFAARSDCPDYDTLMQAATIGIPWTEEGPYTDYYGSSNDGEYLHFGGKDAHGDIPPEFWDHVQVVTGQEIPQNKRARYFSCSC